MTHWRIVFLPKPNQWPSPLDMRPICIVYRIWTRIRLTHLRNFLTQFLVPYQSGGIGGPSVQDLLISWHQEFGDYDYCLALDYQKAFDSMDYILPIHVMEQVGVPMQICNLIRYQWDNHKRWCSFNGTVHPQPLVNSKGIPQGDGWSPIALSLVLSIYCPTVPNSPRPVCQNFFVYRLPYYPCAQHAGAHARTSSLATAGRCHAHAH